MYVVVEVDEGIANVESVLKHPIIIGSSEVVDNRYSRDIQ